MEPKQFIIDHKRAISAGAGLVGATIISGIPAINDFRAYKPLGHHCDSVQSLAFESLGIATATAVAASALVYAAIVAAESCPNITGLCSRLFNSSSDQKEGDAVTNGSSTSTPFISPPPK